MGKAPSRALVTAAVAAVGAYAARESGQHRRQERDAKKVQLVLIALEPFIANLPEDSRDDNRAEAANPSSSSRRRRAKLSPRSRVG
jgi:flagellar basal body-associated protein FliL